MKRRHLPLLLNLALALWLAPAGAAADDAAVIIGRYRDLLVSRYAPVQQRTVIDAAAPARWIRSLADDGRWPDIDYASAAGGAWPALDHLRRVRILVQAVADPASPLHADAEATRVAIRALDHWVAKRYQNPNWWQNQIGVPQVMRDIIVLLGDRLPATSRAGAMAVLHQFVLQPAGFGANTVWTGELGLLTAALENDAAALAAASLLVAGEIQRGGGQGVQDDFSFHQHGARLQQFHYGGSFFEDTVRIAWLLRSTPWALPEGKVTLLADFWTQGNAWMARGTVTVPGTLDRAVSRPGALGWADMRRPLAMLGDLLPQRRGEMDAARRMQDGEAQAGFRAFPCSDFTTYHRPAFSFLLKTISLRTEVTETLLRENLKGRKLNWGDHYVLTAGSNYLELPPVWDWDLLPGVTSSVDVDSIQRQAFVGALGDGRSGAAVMDYQAGRGGLTFLSGRKFWAAHHDVVVALIGALHASRAGEPVRTAFDQRRLIGEVTVLAADGISKLSGGHHEKRGVKWIQHDGLLYVPLGDEPVTLSLGPVTGAWRDINLNYSAEPITLPVFLPVIEHGRLPAGAATGFVIAACGSPAEAPALAEKPSWMVLRNDASCQAVRFADGTVMAAFYEPGRIDLGIGRELQVDQACLLFGDGHSLRACDPLQQGKTVTVRVNGRELALVCPAGGKSSEPIALEF